MKDTLDFAAQRRMQCLIAKRLHNFLISPAKQTIGDIACFGGGTRPAEYKRTYEERPVERRLMSQVPGRRRIEDFIPLGSSTAQQSRRRCATVNMS